jgi:hypothetical protein
MTLSRDPKSGLVARTVLVFVTDTLAYDEFGQAIIYDAPASGAPLYGVNFIRDNLGWITQRVEIVGRTTDTFGYTYNQHSVNPRFQRGIMMIDASCTCTQGVLLADYLKSVMTGDNLPGDLNQEAMNSPFYKQYLPGAPNWLRDPSRLPDTDLTNAFTTE